MPSDGWSLHVAVIDPDGGRTATNDADFLLVDTAGRVDKFRKKYKIAAK